MSTTLTENELRHALRRWIEAAAPEDATRPPLTDTTALIDNRFLTSLQITDLILFIEDLRGLEVDIEELAPGTFRDIDSVYRAFFGEAR